MQPKLVEIQGFPSLYAFQPTLAEAYRDAFALDAALGARIWSRRARAQSNDAALMKALLQWPRSLVKCFCWNSTPQSQKTLPDFVLTEKRYGVRTAGCSQEVVKRGTKLYALRWDTDQAALQPGDCR